MTVNTINVANAEIENNADEEKEVRLMKLKFHMKALTIFLQQNIDLDKFMSKIFDIEFLFDSDDENRNQVN